MINFEERTQETVQKIRELLLTNSAEPVSGKKPTRRKAALSTASRSTRKSPVEVLWELAEMAEIPPEVASQVRRIAQGLDQGRFCSGLHIVRPQPDPAPPSSNAPPASTSLMSKVAQGVEDASQKLGITLSTIDALRVTLRLTDELSKLAPDLGDHELIAAVMPLAMLRLRHFLATA